MGEKEKGERWRKGTAFLFPSFPFSLFPFLSVELATELTAAVADYAARYLDLNQSIMKDFG